MSEEVKPLKLEDIVSVGGLPGLHRIIGRNKNGIIVESLDATKKRQAVPLSNKVSILSEISMYSMTDDIKLNVILKNIADQGIPVPSKDSNPQAFKDFMKKALPDYDEERVYVSHIEKLAKWYHILKDHLDFSKLLEEETPGEPKTEEVVKAEEEVKVAEEKTEAVVEEKTEAAEPKKKRTPKKKVE